MSLTNHDASIVLGMIARGDKQQDIAAWFGENQARIPEVESGSHGNLPLAAPADLPPRGAPGPKGRKLLAYVKKAIAQMQNGQQSEAQNTLADGVTEYGKNSS